MGATKYAHRYVARTIRYLNTIYLFFRDLFFPRHTCVCFGHARGPKISYYSLQIIKFPEHARARVHARRLTTVIALLNGTRIVFLVAMQLLDDTRGLVRKPYSFVCCSGKNVVNFDGVSTISKKLLSRFYDQKRFRRGKRFCSFSYSQKTIDGNRFTPTLSYAQYICVFTMYVVQYPKSQPL